MGRMRADLLLVARGLFDSRAKAREAIEARLVRADGTLVAKASQALDETAAIVAEPAYPWVSRGGVKLGAALDAFHFDPSGLTALDVGASTGGFTDVLLARGAAHVTCVDVGRDQLHPRLRADPRVTVHEGLDIRHAGPEVPAADLVVADVSFIGLRLVLPAIVERVKPGGRVILLVKPQFEVGRALVAKGVVRDEAARLAAVDAVRALLEQAGFSIHGPIPSPIAGGDGNVEYLIGGSLG